MDHFAEVVLAGTVALVLLCAALVWPPLPRHKPEPPEIPSVEFVEPASQTQTATVRIRPTEPKTDAQRVEDLTKQVKELSVQQRALKDAIKSVKEDRETNERHP